MMLQYRTALLMISLFCSVTLLTSCDRNRYFEENKLLEKGRWNSGDKVQFEVQISDTLARYDFYLNLRNSLDYPYSNIFLFIHTTGPSGNKTQDTLECQLADHAGKWFGSGSGSLRFNRFLIQKGVGFRQKGRYVFGIEQAMRVKELNGITDVGLRIEKEK